MATHRVGAETVNVSINLLGEEKLIFGRLAVSDDRSLGECIRRLAVAGLRVHNPDAADRIDQIRRHHREQIVLKLESES